MLDEVGIVHMNGRIYDPLIARFLQADPYVQFPGDLQSWNRYSYVMNNPVAHTDPTGHFVFALARFTVAHLLHKHVLSQVPVLNAAAQAFACAYGGPPACIAYAAQSAYAQTGSFQAALKAGALAGVSGAAFNAVGAGPFGYGPGDGFGQLLINAAANGIVGGVMHELQGGKFGHGFLASGGSALAKPGIRRVFGTAPAGRPYRIAARAVIGGTISSTTGGKFVNGAVTAAFSQAYNEEETIEGEGNGPNDGFDQYRDPHGQPYEEDADLPAGAQRVLAGNRRLDPKTGQVVLQFPEDWRLVRARRGGGFFIVPPEWSPEQESLNVVRVQPPGTGSSGHNPDGYYVVYNEHRQPISPYSGKPVNKSNWHNPLGGIGKDGLDWKWR